MDNVDDMSTESESPSDDVAQSTQTDDPAQKEMRPWLEDGVDDDPALPAIEASDVQASGLRFKRTTGLGVDNVSNALL